MSDKNNCEYCHPDLGGNYRSLTEFRINGGNQVEFRLNVASFKGIGVSLDNVPSMYPYGDFRKFKYCPMCSRLLDGSED